MLKSVASSILGEEAQNSAGQKAPESQNNNNSGIGMENLTKALMPSNGIDNIDFDMIMKAKTIFEKMNSTKSKNADLIMALKPHLNPKTQDKADQALRILKLFEILPLLRELF